LSPFKGVSPSRRSTSRRDGGSPAKYGASLKLEFERGWLTMNESGTFVTFTPVGAELFA
jgi:hypothetical protein